MTLLLLGCGSGGSFDPTRVSNLIGWYDASDTSTVTTPGNVISAWSDKSAQSNDGTAGGGSAPTHVVSGINSLGSMDCEKDGVDDLVAANGLATALTGNTAGGSFTVSTVLKVETLQDSGYWMGLTDGFDARFYVGGMASGGFRVLAEDDSANTANTLDAGSGLDSNTHVVTFLTNGTDYTIYLDGAAVTGMTAISLAALTDTATFTSGWVIGNNGGGFDGLIGEQVWYSQALSTADRNSVESYLADKWGVTLP